MSSPYVSPMQRREVTCRNLALATSFLSMAVGVLTLAGWGFRISVLTGMVSGLAAIKPVTAATFLFTGIALWQQLPSSKSKLSREIAARTFATAGALIGLATLVEYGFNADFGFDSLLFHSALTAAGVPHPGRMSEASALVFLLLNSSLLLRTFRSRGQRIVSDCLALSAVAIGFVALLGYIYNARALYESSAYSSTALQATVLFVLLGLGTLLVRPDTGVVSVILSDGPGGAAARRLLPVVTLLPILVGWLRLRAQAAGWFGSEFGVAIVAGSCVIIFAIVVWMNAIWLNRSEEARVLLQEHYRKLAAIVESSEDAIIGKNDKGIVTSWNFGAEKLFGYSEVEMIGQSILRLLPADRRQEEDEILERIQRGETIDHIETIREKKNGELIHVSLTISPIRNPNGTIIGASKIARDISERKRVEESLHESETLYRSLFNSMNEGFCIIEMIFDVQGEPSDYRFIEVNASFEKQTGLQEAVGKRILELAPLHERYWFEFFGKVALTGEPAHFLNEAKELSRYYDVHAYRVGEPEQRRVAIVFEDISERRRIEEHIRRISRLYTMLSDINQTIVREKDPETMLNSACRIAIDKGKFRMAWVGMLDPISHELRPIASSGVVDGYLDFTRINVLNPVHIDGPAARSVITGQHALCSDIEHDPLYLPWRNDALRRGYRSSGAFPLKVDGHIVGALMLYASEPAFFNTDELNTLDEMAADISYALEVDRHEADRRKAEEELRRRTAFFEAQMESSLDGIMVVDSEGKIIFQNQRVYEIWKIPTEIHTNKDDAKQLQYVVSVTKSPDEFVQRIEYLYAHPDEVSQDEIELLDGTILDRYSSPVKDKLGTYYGRIWVFHDITRRRRLEAQYRQAQKMEAIGQLTGGIAHDFNNLLGVILGNLDLLERLVPDDEAALKRVRVSQKAGERGADLTRRLLAFSRSVELSPAAENLHESIQNVIELARSLCPDLSIVVHFDEAIPLVLVDPAGLESAVLNLVVNARDAMPHGGTLTISTELCDLDKGNALVQSSELKAGRYASVSVSDTGHGIAKEALEHVFEPFYTTKARDKGTGLGLAMVYGFVKQSGGSINIYSEPGYGTTVTFYLQLAGIVPRSLPVSAPKLPPRQGTGKILVVDDEVDLLDIAAAFLADMGYTAYCAEDSAGALAIIDQHRDIDLMLTDMIMPGGVNGAELAQKVRQLLPQVKIIYCSGFPAEGLVDRILPVVDAPLLRKPYQRADFETAIRMALE